MDHIGTKRVSVRALAEPPGSVMITRLQSFPGQLGSELELTSEEYFDLCKIVLAAKAAADIDSSYSPAP